MKKTQANEDQMNSSDSSQQQNAQELFSGGNGDSLENAVIVNTSNSKAGIDAEHEFIAAQCGVEGKHWRLECQRLVCHEGIHYDILTIMSRDDSVRDFYFNISKFFNNQT